jgi:peptidoglycan hydrolase-like protein with peptidoglycan-binding domain
MRVGHAVLAAFLVTPLLSFAQGEAALTLDRVLKRNMSGNDVRALQELLARIPSIYPEGVASGYFGPATERAVQRFQAEEGIARSGSPDTTGYGAVGPKTLAKLNEAVVGSSQAAPALSAPTLSASSTASASAPVSATSSASSATTTVPAKASAPARDTAPPRRSDGAPSGVIPMGTESVTISIKTNEPAYCYWSTSPNTAITEMPNPFSTTGGTTHSRFFRNITTGDYAFYVKCRDRNGNANAADYPILFSTEYQVTIPDRYAPRVAMGFPTAGDSITEGSVTLSAIVADNVGVASVRFFLNANDLNAEDMRPPYSVTLLLKPGEYRSFAVARDIDGNVATSSEVTFTVTAKTAVAPSASSNTAVALWPFHTALERLFLYWFGERR